jgi:hypothetical protein
MYAMNLNFKLNSQKSKLAHYEENMKNSLYILQWGEQVCAKIMCDANDRLCTQGEFVLAARTPETPGIYPETPDRMSGQDVRTGCPEYPAKYPECPDLLHRHRKQQVITN